MKKWPCILCNFIDVEAAGLPDEGIRPGTRREDVPLTGPAPLLWRDQGGFRHDRHLILSAATGG
jgi:rubredoxin